MPVLSTILALGSVSVQAEELKLSTPRGTQLNVSVHVPEARLEKAPALVIAPGQGYHKDLPLVMGLADAAATKGVIVYRFNWSYFPGGQPSEDLSAEAEDMQTVLNHAQQDARVDSSKIVIAGKSLGSMVSYDVFAKNNSLLGLVLLTPVCTDSQSGKAVGEEYYPGFTEQSRPIAMVLGNRDPLCSVPMLYDFVKGAKGNVAVNVFGGGHSMTFGHAGDPANSERDARNISAAIQAAAQWMGIILGM